MKQRLNKLFSLLAVCFMLTAYCTTVQAALLDVGPTVPQVIGSTPPTLGHGFPAWYRDTNRVPLEPCYSSALLPSGPACVLLADPGFNPLNPLVFPTNFPGEAFYFVTDALITVPAGKIKYRAGLEAAFATGLASPGGQITFARIRVTADLPVAGTYKFTHPYGVETLVADVPGKRAITFTRDVGVGAFTGAVAGDLGPWLTMTGFPQTVGTETFIGDPNVAGTVTGSPAPFNTNFFRVDGPVGSNLDGLGNNFVQTNLFTVAGKVSTSGLSTPLTVDSATYVRDAINTQVEVFATTLPIANPITGLPPNPFALLGIPSALEFTDATGAVPHTVMLTNNPADGKFFAATATFATPANLPATIRVTNSADIPQTSVDVPLVDEVVITETSFDPATQALKVVASSGDKLTQPVLTVVMLDGQTEVPLGTIAGGGGQLSVTFPVTVTLPPPIGTKSYIIPPESVTVKSANGGSDTDLVTSPLLNRPPVAVNDTATVTPLGSVTINVAANDTAGSTVVPSSVSIAGMTAPTKGALQNNGDGTITYTNTTATGTDTFTYTIQDASAVVSNIATVTVTINRPPVANDDTFTTNEDTPAIFNVILNDTDPDAPANTIAPASVFVTVNPLHGTATPLVDGTVRYTPALNYNGPDSFQYTVRDTLGTLSATAAIVSITVNPVADPPLTVNDVAITPGNTPVTIDVLLNDSHPDAATGSAIVPGTLTIATNPLHGTAVKVAGNKVLYTPALNFFGTDSFTYFVSDNSTPPRVSAAATVTVTITPVNIPPVANPDSSSTFVNIARTINVITNDTDADGTINPASVFIAAPAPTNGTAVANPDGTVTFTPTANFTGTGTFTYNVKDNAGAVSNSALVTVSIQSAVTDSVTVLKAQYTTSKFEWLVQGTTANAAPGTAVTVHVGSNLTGNIIGTTTTDTAGRWKFQVVSGVAPDANRTVSVALPSGASRLAFPVAIK